MKSFRIILSALTILLILPQTIAVAQMGMDIMHGSHDSTPLEACTKTLPCFSAHQPSLPPAVNHFEQWMLVLFAVGFSILGSVAMGRQTGSRFQYIRQFLYSSAGVHMHAFDALRQWIANGLLSQKITPVIAA